MAARSSSLVDAAISRIIARANAMYRGVGLGAALNSDDLTYLILRYADPWRPAGLCPRKL
jgi:hypothetical protein